MPSQLRPIALKPVTLFLCISMIAGGCGLRRPPPPIDRSQDDRIRAEVLARIAAEPDLPSSSIRVEVEGRMVMLHGSVNGLSEWQCAITNAELVPGVQSVVAYLIIDGSDREARCLAPRPDSSFIVGGP